MFDGIYIKIVFRFTDSVQSYYICMLHLSNISIILTTEFSYVKCITCLKNSLSLSPVHQCQNMDNTNTNKAGTSLWHGGWGLLFQSINRSIDRLID